MRKYAKNIIYPVILITLGWVTADVININQPKKNTEPPKNTITLPNVITVPGSVESVRITYRTPGGERYEVESTVTRIGKANQISEAEWKVN